jgi:hypothetical protein
MHGYLIGKKSVLTLWHFNGLLIFKCILKFANLSKYRFFFSNCLLYDLHKMLILAQIIKK